MGDADSDKGNAAGKSIKARSSDSLASTLCPILHPTRFLEEVFNEQIRKTSGKNWLLFLFEAEFLLRVLPVPCHRTMDAIWFAKPVCIP